MKRNDDNLGNLKAHSTLRLRRQSNPAGPGVRTTVFGSSFQRKPNYLTCDQAHGDGNTWPANLLRPWLRAAADNVASLLAFLTPLAEGPVLAGDDTSTRRLKQAQRLPLLHYLSPDMEGAPRSLAQQIILVYLE